MSSPSQQNFVKSQVPQPKCQLLEIVQYSCEPEKSSTGEIRTHCFPLSRIFRMCPNRPAVEITRFTTIDMQTGEIEIPDNASSLPKGKPWRDVQLYTGPNAGNSTQEIGRGEIRMQS